MQKASISGVAFVKQVPSVFIIASPYQLLCSIEAIHEFDIKDYLIVFVLPRGSQRNQQMFTMADEYQISYEIIYEGENEDKYYDSNTNTIKLRPQGIYTRVFIGDVYNRYFYVLALEYAAEGSVYVYIDDGNSTLLYFDHVNKQPKPREWRRCLSWRRNNFLRQRDKMVRILSEYNMYDSRCFFSIYYDVTPRKFIVYPNKMDYVLGASKCSSNKENAVLIVGAAIEAYAQSRFISEILMESIIWKKLSEVREQFKSEHIIYVPHGRDGNKHIPVFCSEFDIEYQKLEETIETYLIKSSINPIAIYGFDSSALISLKKIFPLAEVNTWRIRNKQCETRNTKTLAKYYDKYGIREDIVWVHHKNFIGSTSLYENIASIFWLVYDKITGTKHVK